MAKKLNELIVFVVLTMSLACSEPADSASSDAIDSGLSDAEMTLNDGGNGSDLSDGSMTVLDMETRGDMSPISDTGVPPDRGPRADMGVAIPCAVSPDLDDFIRARMEEDNIPGLAAGIVTSGGLVWSRGYGFADVADSIPVESDTFFAGMSISKMLTAAGVMQQVDSGRLALDVDINTYLATAILPTGMPFVVENPFAEGVITLRHLLSHTSGIAGDDYSVLQLNIRESDAALQPLGEMLASLLLPQGERYEAGYHYGDTSPGAAFWYSSIAISLAAYIAEVISGTDFAQLTKRELFEPLGMTNTSWRLSDYDDQRDRLAVMYNQLDGQLDPLAHFTFAEYPAGSIRTNVPDLARFLAMMINRGRHRGVQVLDEGSVALMEEPPFPDARDGYLYGLGMFIAGDDLRAHGGDDAGAATDIAYDRQTGRGVIVLSNTTRQFNNDVIYQRLLDEAALCP
ncbi:MAG: serine hydrolase domain-containing protein [Bradymonadia bacterium]